MKKISAQNFMIGLFLAGSLALLIWFNVSRPTILVLHSYATDYSWVRDVNLGINRVLKSKSLYGVRWYYMDTKRHPEPEYKRTAGTAARAVIEKMQPNVIIAIDDDAQQFAAKEFINHPKINVIFSGVNNEASDYGYDKAKNVTGLLERLPLPAIREALQMSDSLRLLGRPVRLAFLGDTSGTVKGDEHQVKQFDWAPLQLIDSKLVPTFPEWQAALHGLSGKADVILVTNYRGLKRSDTDKALVPAKEVVAWTEAHAKIPVLSGNGFYTEDGGMLAIGTSPYQQGEAAAAMALQIIVDGKKPNEIPIRRSNQFIVTMSASKMNAREFKLPQVYEAAVRTGDKYFP